MTSGLERCISAVVAPFDGCSRPCDYPATQMCDIRPAVVNACRTVRYATVPASDACGPMRTICGRTRGMRPVAPAVQFNDIPSGAKRYLSEPQRCCPCGRGSGTYRFPASFVDFLICSRAGHRPPWRMEVQGPRWFDHVPAEYETNREKSHTFKGKVTPPPPPPQDRQCLLQPRAARLPHP